MKRFLILLIIALLFTPAIATAQDGEEDTPLYIECGAADYLNYRESFRLAVVEANEPVQEDENPSAETFLPLLEAILEYRDALVFYDEEIPECIQELHELDIERMHYLLDSLLYSALSNDFYSQDFSFIAGQLATRRDIAQEEINEILIDIDWILEITDDGEAIPHPSRQTEEPPE